MFQKSFVKLNVIFNLVSSSDIIHLSICFYSTLSSLGQDQACVWTQKTSKYDSWLLWIIWLLIRPRGEVNSLTAPWVDNLVQTDNKAFLWIQISDPHWTAALHHQTQPAELSAFTHGHPAREAPPGWLHHTPGRQVAPGLLQVRWRWCREINIFSLSVGI